MRDPQAQASFRAYEFKLGSSEGTIIVPPGGVAVPDAMREFHANAYVNSQRAITLNRKAGVPGPLAYLLIDQDNRVAGYGVFCESDGPADMAGLACGFAGMGLKIGFPLPPGARDEPGARLVKRGQ